MPERAWGFESPLEHFKERIDMPPPDLSPKDEELVSQMIETFLHNRSYPHSHSDMKWGFISLLKMFEIKRRLEPYDPIERFGPK